MTARRLVRKKYTEMRKKRYKSLQTKKKAVSLQSFLMRGVPNANVAQLARAADL